MNYNLAEYWEDEELQSNQPTRARMRDYYGKGNNGMRENHYYHNTGFWKELERFLDARVGRDFDYVFSEFCVKFPKHIGRENTRVEFLSRVKDRGRYYIDENNKLARDKTKYWWEV